MSLGGLTNYLISFCRDTPPGSGCVSHFGDARTAGAPPSSSAPVVSPIRPVPPGHLAGGLPVSSSPTCPHCGSVLSTVTWTCVRGVHCPGPSKPRPIPIAPGSKMRDRGASTISVTANLDPSVFEELVHVGPEILAFGA